MTNINIPAVASGAFLGLMALAALIWCFPPITRFLGDLLCCPWRIPFTRKRRRNGDEEMDKDDLPYVAGEPRPGVPVDAAGYQRMSAAYMSAVSVVDPKVAMEEARRSAEYHRRDHSPHGDFYRRDPSQLSHYNGPEPSLQEEIYPGPYLQVPQPNLAHPVDWRRSSPDWHPIYPAQASYGDGPSPCSGHGYHHEGYDVHPPEPSYPPPETSVHQHGGGYLPVAGYDRSSHENVVASRQWTNV